MRGVVATGPTATLDPEVAKSLARSSRNRTPVDLQMKRTQEPILCRGLDMDPLGFVPAGLFTRRHGYVRSLQQFQRLD